MSKLGLFSLIILSLGLANADEGRGAQFKELREKIKNACSQELQASGCEQGKGALKCVRKYYKENRGETQQISDTCKSAMKELKELRKQRKNMKSQGEGEQEG